MKKLLLIALCVAIVGLLLPANSMAATEQAKQQAIDEGLAWLAGTQSTSGSEGYWSYSNDGTLAATASAALAFIEEGYLPGSDFIIDVTDDSVDNPVNYGDVVGKATNYIFNRATADSRFPTGGVETAGYTRRAEDYNNDGVLDGNNQAIYFEPGANTRRVYTTGIVAPVVYALGEAYTPDTVVGTGSSTVSGMTYREVMRDVIDWFSWGQVEPDAGGSQRGGWRYDANWGNSDNSTAQWGALPALYGDAWGLPTPQYVKNELELWANYVQNDTNGGSGYSSPGGTVNVAKTGGLMLEFAELGYSFGVDNYPSSNPTDELQAALDFINSRWNIGAHSTWYGNLNHPYAMWAVYKALQTHGFTDMNPGPDGIPGTDDDFLVGSGMSAAPGGITIGQDWDPTTSAAGDWFSHYCDYLVNLQNGDGSWTGYSYWNGALATGWYINILNATGVPRHEEPVPEPATMLLLGTGLIGLAGFRRKFFKK